MTSTARQLRQPPTIEAIERVPYFADERINGIGAVKIKLPLIKRFLGERLKLKGFLI